MKPKVDRTHYGTPRLWLPDQNEKLKVFFVDRGEYLQLDGYGYEYGSPFFILNRDEIKFLYDRLGEWLREEEWKISENGEDEWMREEETKERKEKKNEI